MADMWQMFADQARLEFGKIWVVAKEKTTHHQDVLMDQSTGSEESGDDIPDDLMLS